MTMDEDAVARFLVSSRGRSVLDEAESLDLLEACGIPVCARERVDPDRGQVLGAAGRIGYPLAIKAIVRERWHKSDHGLVHTGLGGATAVERALDALARSAPDAEGVLVQEHVHSIRELACGLVRDASFGPCVMVGFGGVHAELVADRCFGVAPVGEAEALSMLERLRTRDMLGAYRGGAPADRGALGRILVRLGELGLAFGEVAEVDLNPLMLRQDGSPVAVDALVVLSH